MLSRTFIALIILSFNTSWAADREFIKQTVYRIAPQHDIDPELVLAVIQVESNFNPNAVGSSHGELGLMQLRPEYFPKANLDAVNNISLGVAYLAWVKRQTYKKWGCGWFVAYNVGPNRELKYPHLHSYFKKVISVYPQYCEKLESPISA